MAKKPVKDKNPIVWDCLDWLYQETGMGDFGLHPAVGFLHINIMSKILKIIALIIGICILGLTIVYLIDIWKSLHEQGITYFYLFVASFLCFAGLIPIIFYVPFLPFVTIKSYEDSNNSTRILKFIGWGIFAYFIPSLGIMAWSIIIVFIHGLLFN